MKMPVYCLNIVQTAQGEWDIKVVMGDERTFTAHTLNRTLVENCYDKDEDVNTLARVMAAEFVLKENLPVKV